MDQNRQKLEAKNRVLEEEQAALRERLQAAEAQTSQLKNDRDAEHSGWESERTELERLRREAEERVTRLSAAFEAERAAWDRSRLEWEQKNATAGEQGWAFLKDAEDRMARLMQERNTERAAWNERRAVWDQARQHLEESNKALEEEQAALRNLLQAAEAKLAQLEGERDLERSGWERAREELEQARRYAEERVARLYEEQAAERCAGEELRAAVAKKRDDAVKRSAELESALQEAEKRLAQLSEEFSAERSKWESLRQDQERRRIADLEQQTALRNALGLVESRLNGLLQDYDRERANWERVRPELDQKRMTAEEHAKELLAALQKSEDRVAQLVKENRAGLEQLDELRMHLARLSDECGRLKSECAELAGRWRRMSAISSVGLITAGSDGEVLRCNDAAARMFGFSGAEEAIGPGKPPIRVYAFEGALNERLHKDGKLEGVYWGVLCPDGRVIRLEESTILAGVDAEGRGLVERTLTDVSRTHAQAEQIRELRRKEATRAMAAEAIKSLQDLCVSLVNSGESIVSGTADGACVRQLAEALVSGAARGVKHSQQYLSFAQKADREPQLLDINEVVAGSETLLRSLTGSDIDFQMILSPRMGLALADRQALVQLLCSLAANCREALPLGGMVTIEVSNLDLDAPSSDQTGLMPPGIYIIIAVGADGCNVQPERRVGYIKEMVDRIGGWLEAEHSPQKGNRFNIFLPRVEALNSLGSSNESTAPQEVH